MPAAPDDWRRMGQEEFLPPGTEFAHLPYRSSGGSWDHDHCEFCGVKLAEESVPVAGEEVRATGFATTEKHPRGSNYHWVCAQCYRDFAEEFGWQQAPAL